MGAGALALVLPACSSPTAGEGAPSTSATRAPAPTSTSPTSTTAPGATSTAPAGRPSPPTTTPAIVVETPVPGATVRSPLRVTGSADVFEAMFRVELADAQGRVIVDAQVHASSGTGTRGGFGVTLTFTAAAGPATLQAFDLSARDGSRQDLVSVPVRLAGPP